MEVLNIRENLITLEGLPDVMRLIESTHLNTINLLENNDAFHNDIANQQFVAKLFKNTTIQDMPLLTARALRGSNTESWSPPQIVFVHATRA